MKNHETSSDKSDFQTNEKELPLIPPVRNSYNAQHGIKQNFLNRENIAVAIFLLLSFLAGCLIGIFTNGGLLRW